MNNKLIKMTKIFIYISLHDHGGACLFHKFLSATVAINTTTIKIKPNITVTGGGVLVI